MPEAYFGPKKLAPYITATQIAAKKPNATTKIIIPLSTPSSLDGLLAYPQEPVPGGDRADDVGLGLGEVLQIAQQQGRRID